MPGAMAGGAVDPGVKDYACKSGFFVLGLAGESVHLVPPPDGFVPKKRQAPGAKFKSPSGV
jgi:hypothetical protein